MLENQTGAGGRGGGGGGGGRQKGKSKLKRRGLEVKFNIYRGWGHYFIHSLSQTGKVVNVSPYVPKFFIPN